MHEELRLVDSKFFLGKPITKIDEYMSRDYLAQLRVVFRDKLRDKDWADEGNEIASFDLGILFIF